MRKLQLTIPKPCHEDWNKMTNADKGRFCNACEKEVVDFSAMSDRQLVNFFKKPAGSVCGRFQQDQLEREIAIPRKRIPWIKYFFQFAIPAFLFSMKSNAQQRLGKVAAIVCTKDTVPGQVLKGDTIIQRSIEREIVTGTMGMVAINPFKTISGTVTDEDGTPIPHASVMIKGTPPLGAQADEKGNFKLDVKNRTNAVVVVSAVGFETLEIQVGNQASLSIQLIVLKQMLSGEVIVVGRIDKKQIPSPKKQDPLPVVQKPKDSLLTGIKIYPNPAFSNGEVIIEWKHAEQGVYHVHFLNEAGQQVHKTELEVLTDNKTIASKFYLPELKHGVYFITITNRKTKKAYSQKLLIEN